MSTLRLEYLEIQLRFAEAMADRGEVPIDQAVLDCTNFVRRFGLGRPASAPTDATWRRYVGELRSLTSSIDRLECTARVAADLDCNLALAGPGPAFGPFSAEIVGSVVRTHFVSSEQDGISPLHASKRAQRKDDLRRLFDHVRRRHPEVERVRGNSWLYSTDSYRDLFPEQHIATATQRFATRFQGSSCWGQFLDHRGCVKPDLGLTFIERLDQLDPTTPWRAFPIPTLMVDSPIELFHDL